MSKLVSSRAFRLLVCLLVVCCILVNASPIRAKATAVAPAAAASVVGLSPLAAVAGILVCLGVLAVGSGAFDELVRDVVDALPSKHFLTHNNETMIEGLKYEDTLYVSQDLIADVNDTLYESNTLPSASPVFNVSYSLSEEYTNLSGLGFQRLFNNQKLDWRAHDFNYCYLNSDDATDGTVLTIIFSDSPASVTLRDGIYRVSISGRYASFTSSPGTSTIARYGYNADPEVGSIRSLAGSFCLADVYSVSSSGAYDILVAEAAPDLDDDEEYQAWKARRLFRVIEGGGGDEDPDEDPDDGLRVLLPYYPVPAAENAENLPSSQDQAWVGNRQEDPEDDPVTDLEQSVEVSTTPEVSPSPEPNPDPEPVPEPEPEPDPDPEPAPEPAPDPQPSQALAGTSLEPFVLPSLRNFFPFCIPFDLYDMLAAFVAEPEAPVFTFATGFLGNVFTVDIDLSPWNSIARTVRAIQLCICIVGLAFATRKFIKW